MGLGRKGRPVLPEPARQVELLGQYLQSDDRHPCEDEADQRAAGGRVLRSVARQVHDGEALETDRRDAFRELEADLRPALAAVDREGIPHLPDERTDDRTLEPDERREFLAGVLAAAAECDEELATRLREPVFEYLSTVLCAERALVSAARVR